MAQSAGVQSLIHSLDSLLLDQSFITGHAPTSLDSEVFSQLSSPGPQLQNLLRWFNNIKSFSEAERKKFNKTKVKLEEVVKMVVAETNTLSVPEKKSIIFRNLQEVLGEDRIDEIIKKNSLLIGSFRSKPANT